MKMQLNTDYFSKISIEAVQ